MDWLKSFVKPTTTKAECWSATRTPLAVAKFRALFKTYTETKGEQVVHPLQKLSLSLSFILCPVFRVFVLVCATTQDKLVQLKKVLALFVQLYAIPKVDDPHILLETYMPLCLSGVMSLVVSCDVCRVVVPDRGASLVG